MSAATAKKDMAASLYKAAFRPWRCKAKYIQEIIDGAKTREGRPYTADSSQEHRANVCERHGVQEQTWGTTKV